MDSGVQVALSVSIPTLAVLVGILLNNRQLDQLRNEMNQRFVGVDQRFENLFRYLDAKFEAQHEALLRVEGVMDARLKHLEEKVS